MKASMGIGMLLNGYLLDWIGFVPGAENQIPQVIQRIVILTFVSGPVIVLLALPILVAYPVNRQFMADIKTRLAKK